MVNTFLEFCSGKTQFILKYFFLFQRHGNLHRIQILFYNKTNLISSLLSIQIMLVEIRFFFNSVACRLSTVGENEIQAVITT